MGAFGIDTLCETAALTFAMSAPLFGALLSEIPLLKDGGQCNLLDMPKRFFGSRVGTCFKTHHCSLCFCLRLFWNLALVGLTIGVPVIVAKHLECGHPLLDY